MPESHSTTFGGHAPSSVSRQHDRSKRLRAPYEAIHPEGDIFLIKCRVITFLEKSLSHALTASFRA